MLLFKLIESLDEIHSCLLRILMWNYQSKLNYLCVKLRVHFRVFPASSGPSNLLWGVLTTPVEYPKTTCFTVDGMMKD